jgi:hypothetical protein
MDTPARPLSPVEEAIVYAMREAASRQRSERAAKPVQRAVVTKPDKRAA